MLVTTKNNKNYLIEVKPDDRQGSIREGAAQIVDYYFQYINGDINYFVNENKIKIDGFLLATDSSLRGVMSRDETLINFSNNFHATAYSLVKKYSGCLPYGDGDFSFHTIRDVFKHHNRRYDKKSMTLKPLIGFLRAYDENNNTPFMFAKLWTLKGWKQKWRCLND